MRLHLFQLFSSFEQTWQNQHQHQHQTKFGFKLCKLLFCAKKLILSAPGRCPYNYGKQQVSAVTFPDWFLEMAKRWLGCFNLNDQELL